MKRKVWTSKGSRIILIANLVYLKISPLCNITGNDTTKKKPISDQKFMTDPKSPLKKSYL